LSSSGSDGISAPLWKTPLFYAGPMHLLSKKAHYYELICDRDPKMARKRRICMFTDL
jgi:hypothetical protein